MCSQCTTSTSERGKISTRKELTDKKLPIGRFHNEIYIPFLKKYAFHLPHIIYLSKNHSGCLRKAAFLSRPNDVMCRRDYVERLTEIFNNEIQSSYFGHSTSLSMEGSTVE